MSARFPLAVGADSGVGKVTAVRLIEEGARVVATDVVPQSLEELGREHPSDLLVTVAGDIASPETVLAIKAAAAGRVAALANVAGIMDGFLASLRSCWRPAPVPSSTSAGRPVFEVLPPGRRTPPPNIR
ncbi:SDR family NAD(P)-dependent oxidoreductase [Arthrobacter alpinus]|uniref:SDR family NAD(P)-dependent oxidoreductase n=1 Tax=Arthrobacter alpinus TaxID=656366 RepID=UPI0018D123F7|nr:SDR family NAD(P)-dependent oxidoreductase [Arthrobacter alpinus]